jgi:hypothetical protein
MKKLEIELTDNEWLTLQMEQYRNGETLSDTLLRLSGIRNKGDSKPHELLLSLCDLISNGHSTSDILKSRFWNADLRYYFTRTENKE